MATKLRTKLKKLSRKDSFKHGYFSKANLTIFAIIFAAIGGYFIYSSFAATTDLHATPSTFASIVSQAKGGETIYLASGDYGTWLGPGSAWSSMVTIKPEPGATPLPTIGAVFGSSTTPGDSNVTIDGLAMQEVSFRGDTHDITIKNSQFIGSNIVFQDNGTLLTHTPANILIDHNYISGYNKNGPEGRVQILSGGSTNLGITIQNNCLCDGGNSDGFQGSANGVIIQDNTFYNIHYTGTTHVDALQSYGGPGMIIRRNVFKDVPNGIVAYDGVAQNTIEDNLFYAPNDNPWCITLLSDKNSVVEHNTAVGTNCLIRLGDNISKGMAASSGTIIRDNIGYEWGTSDSGTDWSQDHNLWINSAAAGTGNLHGTPAFVGGDPSPMGIGGPYASYAGVTNFLLAPGSIGKNAASDGLDMGIRANTGSTQPPTPSPPPSGTPKLGDINKDGSVDIFDLSILLTNYNTSTASCDLNTDGTVNIFDLSILLSNYGT